MRLRDVMRPGPYTTLASDSLGNAQRAMSRARVRHLPVMSDGRLVGMLSERDVLLARAHADGDPWWTFRVSEVMRAPAQTAGPDDSLTEAAGRMATSKIGALPIVEQGKLLGLATVGDVLEGEVRSAMGPSRTSQLTAADVMTPWPWTVHPDTDLGAAVALMLARHVRHLPVIDHASTLVGMLSERDVRSAIGDPVQYAELHGRRSVKLAVGKVMSAPPIAVPFDTPVVELARRFADERIGAIPVLDKFGALLGIVSYVDALHVLGE